MVTSQWLNDDFVFCIEMQVIFLIGNKSDLDAQVSVNKVKNYMLHHLILFMKMWVNQSYILNTWGNYKQL